MIKERIITIYGLIGLTTAAKKFDPSKGYKFSTLAVLCIRNKILSYIRDDKSKKIDTVSLYEPISNDDINKGTLIEQISDNTNIEDELIKKEKMESILKAVKRLKPDEQKLIKLYYFDEVSQREIGKELGVSQCHVSRKHVAIIEKIKRIIKYDKE